MAKSLKFKNNTYLDTCSIAHYKHELKSKFQEKCMNVSNGFTMGKWMKLCNVTFDSHNQGEFLGMRIYFASGNNGRIDQNAYIDLNMQMGWSGERSGIAGCNAVVHSQNSNRSKSNTTLKIIANSNVDYDIYFYTDATYCKPNYTVTASVHATVTPIYEKCNEPNGTTCYLNIANSIDYTGDRNTTGTYMPIINGEKLDYTLRYIPNGLVCVPWEDSEKRDWIATMAFLAFWNGAHRSDGGSNLQYCNKGAFGDMATKSSSSYVERTTSSTYNIGEGSGYNMIRANFVGKNDGNKGGIIFTNGKEVGCVTGTNSAFVPCKASSFINMSSKLVKKNIKDVTEEEAKKILDLRPVDFDYKKNFGEKNQVGLIAEEVLEVLPKTVNIPEEYKEEDFDINKGINNKVLSLDYTKFVPYMIKLMKMQQEEINTLKEKIERIEKGK